MTPATSPARAMLADRRAILAGLVVLAFVLRLVAAFVVQRFVDGRQRLDVFPDTDIYWRLAGAIRAGTPYEVSQWGVPHRALRTPGYPLFLAACRAIFGAGSLLPERIVQAALGAASVLLVYDLVKKVRPGGSTALVAAALAAVEPYTVGMSVLVLSEALFVPLLLLALRGQAALWGSDPPRRPLRIALATGLAHGAAVLVRPSWALAVPVFLLAGMVIAERGRRTGAIRNAVIAAVGVALVMAPWWARNARLFDRFVPTALWVGASLYDGLNPEANGGSDMTFLEAPDVRPLDEVAQDALLRDRSLTFAKAQPQRVLELAAIKVGRFWSPWPNADTLRGRGVAAASALVTVPVFALIGLGAWHCRRDARALVLLLGPLLYFCALHAVFVSSIRYRIPAEVPALGLAAVGLGRLMRRRDDAPPAANIP